MLKNTQVLKRKTVLPKESIAEDVQRSSTESGKVKIKSARKRCSRKREGHAWKFRGVNPPPPRHEMVKPSSRTEVCIFNLVTLPSICGAREVRK